ncbi:Aste57867_9037 [Aphanomyces stellatus]|uniref:Aste57867_9037 protein n=1 Tax=Aphanomyces stellatus TaxID=120398 RepID=A0A485KLS2_9STRA|nr:hypothetical protein As57867_009001 [Aphanomyces stellatus]VFT85921.1 Aste57867_9037 [Aphanomyces stellatus]
MVPQNHLKMAFSFGGSTSGAAPAATGFNFGSSTPAASTGFGGFGASSGAVSTPAPASSGFSFGGAASVPAAGAAPATGGFSFGGASSSAAPAAAPASTGFSFGGSASTPAAAPSTGFNFGASSTPAASTGFSFGGASSTPAAAPASTGFSFGGSSSTPAASTGFGFGGSTANQTSLFGKPAAAPSTGFGGGFGGGLFGAQAAAPSGFGGAPAAPAISLDMRFEQLPAEVQKQLKEFDQFLKEQSREEASIRSVSSQRLSDLKDSTTQLEQVALVMRNIQTRQAKDIQTLKSDVKDLVSQAEAADQIHIHMTSETGIQRKESMPSEYYWTLLRDFEQRMLTLKSQMADVHMQLQGLQQSRSDATFGKTHATPLLIQQILQAQNDAFMKIAAHVAGAHEQADALRDQYLAMLQRQQAKQRPDGAKVRNPFDAADRIQAEEERRVVDRIRLSAAQVTLPAAGAPAAATGASSSFSFGQPATTTVAAAAFGGFGAAAAPATTSAFGGTSSFGSFGATPAPSAFGAAPAAASPAFGAPAQPTLTKSVSFAGLGSAPATEPTSAFGMPAANNMNKSVRRKSSSTKKR